jgi:cyclohexa-1,5-dienecarbonyl-CoA hydratase
MTHTKVRIQPERDGAVLRLVIDSPPGNVIDLEMIEALRGAVVGAGHEPGLKAVILEGAGGHFSYGASVPEHRTGEIERVLPRFHDLFRDLFDLARPLVAVVRGKCLGGGLELATFCNWIFASPDAQLGQPEIRLGVFAPVGSMLLAGRVGRPAAEAMCLTGQVIEAEDALEDGLVDFVAEDPGAAADAWIEQNILPLSAVALHHALRAVRFPMREEFMRGLEEIERMYLRELMRTEDAREGIAAFLEKRPPVWRNR